METKKKNIKTVVLRAKQPIQWLRGRLCPIRKESAWFMKPLTELPEGYNRSRDVFMYPNYLPQFVLPVVQGDVLEFALGDRDKTRPMAIKVRISQYSPRTCKELIVYMRQLIGDIDSANFSNVMVYILPCTAMWRFLGSPILKGVQDAESTSMIYIEVLLSLLKLLLKHGKRYKTLLEDVIKTVTRGAMFQDTNMRSLPSIIRSCNYTNTNSFYSEDEETSVSVELVRSFCHEAIRLVPSVTRCLLPTVNAINRKIASPSTQNFLYDLLSLTHSAGEIADANIWMEIPLIPSDHELAGHLIEKDQHLLPVRTNAPYDDPEQYMDIYFRLLRAETFSAVQHGIKDLKASKLDLRDMNVYHSIHLAGFEFQGGRFSVAIRFTPIKNVKKWEASPQLMYGNLVCLSINQRFDDVIWATVSNRDADLLNKHQIIMLELLDDNVKSMSEIINLLQAQGGSAVMVESPTYYHSLSPVLQSLKEFDMENFPLLEEIVYAKPGLDLPYYLKGATLQTAIICSSKKATSTSQENQKDKPNGEDCCNLLETSERKDWNTQLTSSSSSSDSSVRLEALSGYSSDDEINSMSSYSKRAKSPKESRTKIRRTISSSSSSSLESLDMLPDFEEIGDTEPLMKDTREERIDLDSKLFLGLCKAGSCIKEDETYLHETAKRLDPESMEKLKRKQSEEVVKDCSIETQSDNTSREPRDKLPQSRLGERMTVEHFLATFNLRSESKLEASQREALIHALKNRVAVIQGPPGCGKTYIGVKIVQLLLSLKPKLEKPILLLTYKNHALDEFLKHMLRFCKKDDIVRIGGRSKEPVLESCNLKIIQNNISYAKSTSTEIQDIRSEITVIESEIKKISTEVEASGYLTQKILVDELTEEQLQSLMIEADWGNGTLIYRQNKRNVVNKLSIKSWLDYILQTFGSVKEFLQRSFEFGVSNKNFVEFHCLQVFQKVLHEWLPDRRDIQRMKEFQVEFTLQTESDSTTDEDEKTKSDSDDEDDSGDEEYVKQILESRMASGLRQGSRLKNDLVLFNPSNTKNKKGILVDISDYPADMPVSGWQIRFESNLWRLMEAKRVKFLYCILSEKTSSVARKLNLLLERLQILKNRKQELEINEKVEMLSCKKIIGVTITGASINHDLLHHVGPNVVIVEEAAEILEPSLLAALTPSVEHLILIGDHKQLRPQVDTYELCKNFDFDVSMMERLIDSGFPYKSLTKQNRMRPEFSALLRDIYPNLEDNLPLVSKNEPLKCIGKSMFFWSHDDPEKHDRTYSNVKEAERVVALVLYLLCNGCPPSEITVLAAYLGQTKLLRNMIKKEKTKQPKLFQEIVGGEEKREGSVQVQTIDMYQGDENKYVIISLVRSNKENSIGFLNKMNRRCVAQSRAKCGMYFVGNFNTLLGAKGSCWPGLITSMMEQDCVANEIPLQCTKHKESKYQAIDATSIHKIIAHPKLLCAQLCGGRFPRCDKHPCKKLCFPRHWHYDCPATVDDIFPNCGHPVKRKCPKNIADLRCEFVSIVDLPCGHEGSKKCCVAASDVVCRIPVTATFPRCQHQTEKECHVKIETMSCKHPCDKMNSCEKHPCQDVCGRNHGHDRCTEMIDYHFPKCGHPSSKQKKCSEEITWNCKYKVHFTGVCGHDMQKECYQSQNEVKCQVRPCGKTRKCGHPCTNACGDDCEKGECKHCQRVYQKKMEEFRAAAKKRVKEIEEKIEKKEIPNFSRDEIRCKGPNAAEYQKVKDQVEKFIQPCHRWFPTITKIEKVTNLILEKKFEAAKSRAFGDYIDTKFHGTSNDGVRGITRNGFKMPEANPQPPKKRGMFGQGIYFATDSSKSAQRIYTQGSEKLLLCQVILGKSMTVEKADNTLNKKKLRSRKFDSVYAPRGTAVMNDEFVIFDPDQALPQYIIHFSGSNTVVPPSPSTFSQNTFTVKKMLPSRAVNFQDPFEMYYSFAESHFRRMTAAKGRQILPQQATISSIDIVINKDLEQKFEATRQRFKSQGIPDNEVLAYHGTDQNNIDSILKSNLQLKYAKRQVYGKGNYFSEFPAVSLGYGNGLLLCRILPGKEFVDVDSSPCDIPQGYNSKKLLGSQSAGATAANASGKMIIIENSDQILPFFVIHR